MRYQYRSVSLFTFCLFILFISSKGFALNRAIQVFGGSLSALSDFTKSGTATRADDISAAFSSSVFELKAELYQMAFDHFDHSRGLEKKELKILKKELCSFPGINPRDLDLLASNIVSMTEIDAICQNQSIYFENREQLIKLQLVDQVVYSDISAHKKIFASHIKSEQQIEWLLSQLKAVGVTLQMVDQNQNDEKKIWNRLVKDSEGLADLVSELTQISIPNLRSYFGLIKNLRPTVLFIVDAISRLHREIEIENSILQISPWFLPTLEQCGRLLNLRKVKLMEEGCSLYQKSANLQRLRIKPIAELIHSANVETFTHLRKLELDEIDETLNHLNNIKKSYLEAKFIIRLARLN